MAPRRPKHSEWLLTVLATAGCGAPFNEKIEIPPPPSVQIKPPGTIHNVTSDVNAQSYVRVRDLVRDGITAADMCQGDVGDCYLIAGMRAIAVTHSDLIFGSLGLLHARNQASISLAQPVSHVAFFSLGRCHVVPIRPEVPAHCFHKAVYAQLHDGFPALIEKAWAAHYGRGSYQRIHGGRSAWYFDAVGCGVKSEVHQLLGGVFADPGRLRAQQKVLLQWKQSGYPMTVSFVPRRTHAGSLEFAQYPSLLRLRNDGISHAFAVEHIEHTSRNTYIHVTDPRFTPGDPQHKLELTIGQLNRIFHSITVLPISRAQAKRAATELDRAVKAAQLEPRQIAYASR